MKSDCHFQKYIIGLYSSALAFNRKHSTTLNICISYFHVHFSNIHSSINILQNFMRFCLKGENTTNVVQPNFHINLTIRFVVRDKIFTAILVCLCTFEFKNQAIRHFALENIKSIL